MRYRLQEQNLVPDLAVIYLQLTSEVLMVHLHPDLNITSELCTNPFSQPQCWWLGVVVLFLLVRLDNYHFDHTIHNDFCELHTYDLLL